MPIAPTGRITHARVTPAPESFTDLRLPEVFVQVDGGPEQSLFTFYHDEISFVAEEFIGLTLAEARHLKFKKDNDYLKS